MPVPDENLDMAMCSEEATASLTPVLYGDRADERRPVTSESFGSLACSDAVSSSTTSVPTLIEQIQLVIRNRIGIFAGDVHE